ncbi:MAG: hypothetical protein HCAMLNBO_02175 [Candidatus Brocadia fulgida]|jgi:hypothetical protein|nr:hypothetical protein [Candidatus Brocadia fulgida]
MSAVQLLLTDKFEMFDISPAQVIHFPMIFLTANKLFFMIRNNRDAYNYTPQAHNL